MAASRVQSKDIGVINSVATSQAVTFDSAPTEGNLIIAVASALGDFTGLAISGTGWTTIGPVDWGTTRRLILAYKIAGAGESSTVTATTTNNTRISLGIVEATGIDTAALVDVSRTNKSAATSVYTGITDDPSFAGGYKFHALAFGDVTVRATEYIHGASLIGSEFQNGAGRNRMFDEVAAADDDTPADLSITSGNSDMRGVSITVIFKADGAADASDHASGSATVSPNAAVAGTGGSPTLTFSHSPSAGDLLVAILKDTGLASPTITPPSGWTQAGGYMFYDRDSAFSGQEFTASFWYKVADGTEGPNIQFTTSGTTVGGILVNYDAPGAELDLAPAQHEHQYDEGGTAVSGGSHIGTSKRDGATGTGLALAVFISGGTMAPPDSASNGFTRQTNMGTFSVFYRGYSTPGPLSCTVSHPEPSGAHQDMVGYLLTFLSGGGDHWAWAEDSMDSWQVVD